MTLNNPPEPSLTSAGTQHIGTAQKNPYELQLSHSRNSIALTLIPLTPPAPAPSWLLTPN